MDNPSLSPSSSSESLSTSDLEAGFSGTTAPFPINPSSFYSSNRKKSSMYRGSMVGPIHSPRFFSDPLSDDETHHFLDSCFLCKKPLSGGRDIYMYRGDTPFCSEECRQEQIEMDETKEKWNISVKAKEKSNSKSPSKSQKIHMSAAGTVVAG